MIRTLIVDDSVFARRFLTTLLSKEPDIQVIDTASNGEDAILKVRKLDPDVVTMDIEMPKMDGITALKNIMEEMPVPVIMISSLTQEGADFTLKAMEIGALDFIPKISSTAKDVDTAKDAEEFAKELIGKIRAVARRKAFLKLVHKSKQRKEVKPVPQKTARAALHSRDETKRIERSAPARLKKETNVPTKVPAHFNRAFDAVVIGVSTGGPPAVQKVLSAFPENFPAPILIAQHMPAAFTGPFAKRLDGICSLNIIETQSGERLKSGWVYICPGGKHLRVESKGGVLTAVITDEPKSALYKPSANVLLETAGNVLGRRSLGVILTGMGSDGLEGAKILKSKGGKMLAQSEASCVVYGMPKAIVDAGLADEIFDIDDMACAIMKMFS